MPDPLSVVALVVAAGRGQRAGGGLPKQYRDIGGRPLLLRTLENLLAAPSVAGALVVVHPDDAPIYDGVVARLDPAARGKLASPAHGAATRQGSVLAGLEALADRQQPDLVLIHDAARPFVSTPL